jgi:hypothetical protein
MPGGANHPLECDYSRHGLSKSYSLPRSRLSRMENQVSVDLRALTAEIITAHVSNNRVEIASLPDLLKGVRHSSRARFLGRE